MARVRLRVLALFCVLMAVGAVFALAAVLESGVLTPRILAWGNARLGPAAGLHVSASAIYFRPWSGLSLHDVRLSRVRGDEDRFVLFVSELRAGYRFLGLAARHPRLQRLGISRPDLDLEELDAWTAERRDRPPKGEGAGRGGAAGLRIDRIEITEGLVRRDRSALVSDLRFGASLDGAGTSWRLDVEEGAARVTTGRIDETVELTGAAAFTEGALRLDGLHLGVGGGRMSFQGSLAGAEHGGARVLTSGYAIPLERIGSWFGISHSLLSGELQFRFLTTGTPDSLRVNGTLRGVDDRGADREFRFALEKVGSELRAESLNLVAGGSRVELEGRMTLGEIPRLEGVAVLRDVDPALVLGEQDLARVTGLRGTVRFEGTGATRETFDGFVDVALESGSVFGLDLQRCELRAVVQKGGVEFRDLLLERGGTTIRGSGTIDAENQVSARLSGTIPDLAALDALAGGASAGALQGQASVALVVRGPLAGPALEARLHLDDASVLGTRAGTLDLTLQSEALGRDGAIQVDMEGRDVGFGDRVIARAVASGTFSQGRATIRNLKLESERRGLLRLEGALAVGGGGDLTGRITKLEVDAADGVTRWSNQGPVRVERTQDALVFSGLDLRSGPGRIAGEVRIAGSGETFIDAEGTAVDLAVFSPFLLPPEPLSGTLDFVAKVAVSRDTLGVDLEMDLRQGAYGKDQLERVRGAFRMRDDRISMEDVVLRSTFAVADVNGDVDLVRGTFREAHQDSAAGARIADHVVFRDVRVAFEAPDADRVKEVLPWFPSPGGAVYLDAQLNGTWQHPQADLALTVVDGRIGQAPLDRLVVSASYDGERLNVREAQLASRAGNLEARGSLPVAWSFSSLRPEILPGDDVGLAFQADSLPVRSLAVFSPLFEMSEGVVTADARLTGSRDSLWLEGTFRAENGKLTIPEFQDPLVNGFVEGTFDREGVHFSTIRFQDGQGGRVTGSGLVRLPSLRFEGMDVSLEGKGYHYRSERGIRGVGNGRVRITEKRRSDGKLVPLFRGAFDVERGELDERIFLVAEAAAENVPDMPRGVQLPEEARRAPGAAEELGEVLPTPVFVEMDFAAEKNVWIQTEEMEVEAAGAVTFHMDEDRVGLSGVARTRRGRYAVLNTEFKVRRAEVRFVDPSDMMASIIDAEATTTVLDERVTFEVTGTLGEPILRGSTESGMSESEIYELLALRQKRSGSVDDQGVITGAFYESWGALLATRFGRELSREIGIDTFDLEVEGQSQNLGVGKYFGPDVFLRYRERIGQRDTEAIEQERWETPERQLLLEYRLSRIFQLQGETGVIQEDPYLNVDLKAEWGY